MPAQRSATRGRYGESIPDANRIAQRFVSVFSMIALAAGGCDQTTTSGQSATPEPPLVQEQPPVRDHDMDDSSDEPIVRFVSVPDFINMDMQRDDPRMFDLTTKQQTELTEEIADGGPQATINPHVGNFIGTIENGYLGASQVLLEALRQEQAEFLTISGDMLYTRWPKTSQLGEPGAAEHIIEQGHIFYDALIENIREYGGYDYTEGNLLTIVGDHELGDNDWPENKRQLLTTYRGVFVDKLGGPKTVAEGGYVDAPCGLEGRTYAVKRGNVVIIGLDQFSAISNRTGPIDVSGAQLQWLEETLVKANADTTVDHIVVLAHAPIALQQSVQSGYSSRLMNDTDESGPLWQLFAEYGVDLYLPGEVHAISMQVAHDVLQVVTGTNIFQPVGPNGQSIMVSEIPFEFSAPGIGEQNYLVVDSYADRLELTIKQIETHIWGYRGTSNDPVNDEPYKNREVRVARETAEGGFSTVGTMTIYTAGDRPVYAQRTGLFESAWSPKEIRWSDGTLLVDFGRQTSPKQTGYTSVGPAGIDGDVTITFSTDGNLIDSRDRGEISGETQSDLLRDFVFGDRNNGASYLDISFGQLAEGQYCFDGLFHDALSTAETDPIVIAVNTGAGFVEAAHTTMSAGPETTSYGRAQLFFRANGHEDVVVRITNLDTDGPHMINGFTLTVL